MQIHDMMFVERCFFPRVSPYDSDVLVDVGFKIQRWDETGVHVGKDRQRSVFDVGSACSFGHPFRASICRGQRTIP